MPSIAFLDLKERLKDVKELLKAHAALTGERPGRRYEGSSITRAGVVLLAAATEAFVEDLFNEAAELIFSNLSREELEKFKKATSRRLNNADVYKVELLFFNLGCPFILKNIKWQKYSNATFKTELNRLIENRNKIAHGKSPKLRLASLRKWSGMIENFAPRFQACVRDHIIEVTGTPPPWL